MEVIFYSEFAKRKNSTKNPTSAGAISVSVTKQVRLKGKCDLIRPSFFVTDVTGFVYCKAWNTYYHITKIAYDIDGAEYIECEIDALGTWRDAIKSTSAFVHYSSSDYSADIIDSRVAQLTTKSYAEEVEESVFVGSYDAGCFVVTTASSTYGSVGWILRGGQYDNLVAELLAAGSDVWQSLKELFGDAVGSIFGVRYIPIPYSKFYDGEEIPVEIGDYVCTSASGIPTDAGHLSESVDISIPWRYGDFRRCSEFTNFSLTLPFVGHVELSAENLIGYTSLHIDYVMCVLTGQVAYGVYAYGSDTPKFLGVYNASFGRQVAISADQINAMGVLGGAITAGIGAYGGMAKNLAAPLSLGGYGGGMLAVGTVIGGVVAATIAANKHDFVTIGGYEGCASEELFPSFILASTTNDTRTDPDELTDLYGRPCMKVLKLTELTGYVQTIGFSIDINALDEIKEMINNAMDSGVYLE